MTRECVRKLSDEFEKIDAYLERYAEKYGMLFFEGADYIICEPEEKDILDSGETIYSGGAYSYHGMYTEEKLDWDETEDIDQVEIHIELYHYEKDSDGSVMYVEPVGSLRWKGGTIGI